MISVRLFLSNLCLHLLSFVLLSIEVLREVVECGILVLGFLLHVLVISDTVFHIFDLPVNRTDIVIRRL